MSDSLNLGIHFLTPEIEEMYRSAGFQDNISSGFDLMCVEEVTLTREKPFALLNLGVVIKPPEGFHSLLIPRSSTYKTLFLIQTNHVGLIDANYCGIKDVWKVPVYFLTPDYHEVTIPRGTRVCQFFLEKIFRFSTYRYNPPLESRSGFGSTGGYTK